MAPMIMLRRGRLKFVHTPVDPDQLFDVAADPHELTNLATSSEHREAVAAMRAEIARRWDIPAFDAAVRTSKKQCHLIHAALRHGRYFPWDFQPLQQASERYMGHHLDLNVVESDARFPKA